MRKWAQCVIATMIRREKPRKKTVLGGYMKKSVKCFLTGALSLMLASTLVAEQVLRAGATENGLTVSTSASFKDVTGEYDTSALRAKNLNKQVLNAGDVAPTYETRTVIISLKEDNLIDFAEKEKQDVTSYIDSFSGQRASAKIREQQDAFLSKISQKGISYQ